MVEELKNIEKEYLLDLLDKRKIKVIGELRKMKRSKFNKFSYDGFKEELAKNIFIQNYLGRKSSSRYI